MSRHRRNVPSSFYHRFARDVVKFANQHAGGKVLAVLEGGYSDRALCSGTLATLVGLAEAPRFLEKTFLVEEGDEKRWWDERTLVRIEKACRAGARRTIDDEPWLTRTVEIFARIEGTETGPEPRKAEKEPVGRGMQLRERRPRGAHADDTPQTSPARAASAARSGPPASASTMTKTPSSKLPKPVPTTALVADPAPPVLVSTTPLDPPAPGAPPKIKFTWKEGGIGVPRT